MSRPARARGLKHIVKQSLYRLTVAPRAGAWIETLWISQVLDAEMRSRPARARGLKLRLPASPARSCTGRAPRGRVD